MRSARSTKERRGFALLLTLILVMLAVIALAAVARQSTSEALAAQDATEALQRRWAVTSCRSTLLPRVGRVLEDIERVQVDAGGRPLLDAEPVAPAAHRWLRCTLAGVRYDLVLTDEQAKLNPGAVQKQADQASARKATETLAVNHAAANGWSRMAAVLRPMKGLDSDGGQLNATTGGGQERATYASFGQLLADPRPELLLGKHDQPGLSEALTCWGDGGLHLRRASRSAVESLLQDRLSKQEIDYLLDVRDASPHKPLRSWLDAMAGISVERRKELERDLTDRSSCQGLWVVARGKTRSWYSFSVIDRSTAGGAPASTGPGVIGGSDTPRVRGAGGATRPGAEDQSGTGDDLSTDIRPRRYDFAW